jgi:hypothetical protein
MISGEDFEIKQIMKTMHLNGSVIFDMRISRLFSFSVFPNPKYHLHSFVVYLTALYKLHGNVESNENSQWFSKKRLPFLEVTVLAFTRWDGGKLRTSVRIARVTVKIRTGIF